MENSIIDFDKESRILESVVFTNMNNQISMVQFDSQKGALEPVIFIMSAEQVDGFCKQLQECKREIEEIRKKEQAEQMAIIQKKTEKFEKQW